MLKKIMVVTNLLSEQTQLQIVIVYLSYYVVRVLPVATALGIFQPYVYNLCSDSLAVFLIFVLSFLLKQAFVFDTLSS